MKQGTFELAFLGVAFLALQVYWIRIMVRNGQNQEGIDINRDPLAEEKKRLEKLLQK